jgi:two-component system sensor histidine kinase PhoQ
MKSLRTRLLVAASGVLAIFMLLCGAGLEQAFRSSAQQAVKDRQQGLIFGLIGASDPNDNDTLSIDNNALPDPRLKRVQSGLEAVVYNERNKVVWRSPSFTQKDLPPLPAPAVGTSVFTELDDRFALTYGLRWVPENSGGLHLFASKPRAQRYTVAILEDKTGYRDQLHTFRRVLWSWLGGFAVALLAVQVLVLRWGLTPLPKLVGELRRIETNEQTRIEGTYPTELTPLASGLNAMIAAERSQQQRYRNALDDLAHSLKTPLAVMRGLVDDSTFDGAARERLREPVDRMQRLTEHQLRKAATAGRRTFLEPVPLQPIIDKIAGAIGKVYAAKSIRFDISVAEALRVRADEGDLYELLGNLMDNAGKWCKGTVAVTADVSLRRLSLRIDDDGPGFPPESSQLLERGVRADSLTPGQGIGLGAAAELVKVYDGEIELGRSPLGGGRVSVVLTV